MTKCATNNQAARGECRIRITFPTSTNVTPVVLSVSKGGGLCELIPRQEVPTVSLFISKVCDPEHYHNPIGTKRR